MSDLIVVSGEDCLDYITKPIGIASVNPWFSSYQDFLSSEYGREFMGNTVERDSVDYDYMASTFVNGIRLCKWDYDVNKRIVGIIDRVFDDGGLLVKVIGNDVVFSPDHNIHVYKQVTMCKCYLKYETPIGTDPKWYRQTESFLFFPEYAVGIGGDKHNYGGVYSDIVYDASSLIPFDDVIDFNPLNLIESSGTGNTKPMIDFDGFQWEYWRDATVTNKISNCMVIGQGIDDTIKLAGWNNSNPLNVLSGDLYECLQGWARKFFSVCPPSFDNVNDFNNFRFDFGITLANYNFTTIPFNLILTNSAEYAQEYLRSGTLPPDAHLYPLDWNNLPKYDEPVPTGDKPDDFPDDNDPDDDDRDFDPTPPETPSFTVNQLTNYNWYWLTVPEWSAFISWFWNDIGDYSDFDDIIAKVKGLYNDVASAVIMCRYYPVDISWIGGLGTQSNIKLGMIEKAGAVDTISQANSLHAVDIGHVHIGTKYKSFMDMSPYSQLSLYLPWHGFIDLDMNLFNGHDVYVKALYDYLSGTIQYYIYYDNELLVNTILCKMAMDIPITLQTKNDRDSAIFNNVSSTIGGLVGAGAGIMSGNPIGMTLGVTQGVGAFNSSNASAPMRLMGNVGESGAYIGFQNCFVVVRRPTIQPSDGNSTTMKGLSTWKRNVGMLCGYGYTLSDLSGQGFTVCHSPRIDFKSTTPLQTEVDEIYSYLEKGVIL